MPVHHKLEVFLDEYLDAAGLRGNGKGPLFRSTAGRSGTLTATAMNRVDAYRMIRRRTAEAEFKNRLGCHVFRATGITAYLDRLWNTIFGRPVILKPNAKCCDLTAGRTESWPAPSAD